MTILSTIQALEVVAQVKAWNDRSYVTLAAAAGSRSNADLKTKIWLKGDTLTFETAKGYHSDEFIAAKYALISATEAAGGKTRQI